MSTPPVHTPQPISLEEQLALVRVIKQTTKGNYSPKMQEKITYTAFLGAVLTLNQLNILPPWWHVCVMAHTIDRCMNELNYVDAIEARDNEKKDYSPKPAVAKSEVPPDCEQPPITNPTIEG